MTCTTDADPQYPIKDPDAKLDFGTSWADWLSESETISASEWFITEGDSGEDAPETVLKIAVSPPPSIASKVAFVWLIDGTLGRQYAVVNRITTNQGRTEDRTKYVTIQEK